MDDEAAIRAHRVAAAASAWLNAPQDHGVYRRLVEAVDHWNQYASPRLPEPSDEVLDELGAASSPTPLGAGLPALEQHLRRQHRQAI